MTVPVSTEELLQRTIDRFWETIPPTWNSIRGHLRTIAADHYSITVEQFHILRHIRKGIHSVSELADVKQISRPAISQAVELLVEKGLIDRQKSRTDRRFVQLELTDSGRALINAIFEENRDWMIERLADRQPEDFACLLQALDILKESFQETDL